jgi:hypothetical protein
VGNVYSRKGTKKLWIKYLQHGRVIRESAGTDNIVKARRILRDREGDVVKGVPVNPNVGKITFDEAAADLLNDYSMNRKKTRDDAERRIRKHPAPFFGNRRLITITTSDLRAYIAKRQKEGTPMRQKRGKAKAREIHGDPEAKRPVSAGEINRELTVLNECSALQFNPGGSYTSRTSQCCARTMCAPGSSNMSSTWRCYRISLSRCVRWSPSRTSRGGESTARYSRCSGGRLI